MTSEGGAGAARGEERGRCSVFDCARPAVVTYRAGALVDERCAVHASFPSARACLLAGLPVRNGQKRGWAIYPTGGEYDLYPGDEGPQRELTLDEALDAIGGDQQCVLAPAGVIQWPTINEGTQQLLLAGVSPNGSANRECPDLPAIFRTQQTLERMVEQGWLSADDARPVFRALENARHECVLKSL